MGTVSEPLYEDVDGWHCHEKYLSLFLKSFRGIKDESETFSFLLRHGNCHKYLCRTNTGALRCSLSPVAKVAPQRDVTLCHTGATKIYTPVAMT